MNNTNGVKSSSYLAVVVALLLPSVALLHSAQAAEHPVTLLVTHPRASVLHYYVTLARHHLLNIPNVRLVGIYHESENEDYHDAQIYLRQEKIDWISLRQVHCPLKPTEVFANNACRNAFRELVEQSAGVILNGGPDIQPALYGRPQLLSTLIETPHRHNFEVSFLANLLGTERNERIVPLLASRPDYPVLGICVGMQSLNVADGGTLVQDIPSELYGARTVEDAEHADPNTWHRNHFHELDPEPDVSMGIFHPVVLTPQAPAALRELATPPPLVLSIHHQAVDRLGRDYVVTATSVDGKVVEGIRHKTFAYVQGWQFHPEKTALWDATEVQRRCDGDPERNFAYDTLMQDSHSRAFNMAIWAGFSAAVVHAAAGHP